MAFIQKGSKSNRDIVYGINAVAAALETVPDTILSCWMVRGYEESGRLTALAAALERLGVKIQITQRHYLDEKTGQGAHQGVVIEVKATPPCDDADLEAFLDDHASDQQLLLVILDGVTDPRNLGAVMRSACAAGADGVIVPKDRAANLTPAARKVASGAADLLPLYAVTNLSRVIEGLRERFVRVVGLDGSAGADLFDETLTGPLALVLGAEDSGMRRLTREKCDQLVRIDMSEDMESLNVSVAAAVALFEARRQRRSTLA
ncbi:MAG: 23S rRNA (guanosine(2251)-2'-O)-methyltransferase RlmB [Succinivibrionaceae bacterium]|nr:23S rRNA (guanosine(2251)-2'-O)-methyltransferase RlmB [Succinivibrionaceae bacterium]